MSCCTPRLNRPATVYFAGLGFLLFSFGASAQSQSVEPPAPVAAESAPVEAPAPKAVTEAPVEAENFAALAPGFSTPPDTNGAVGPNHLLLTTNGMVRVQDRSGAILSTVNLLSFWSGLGIVDAFDPRGFFDPHSQRFLLITCADRRSGGSSMLFAVSATDDPTGEWYRWRLDGDSSNTDWVDYGNMGFTTDEITFSSNMFTIAGDIFKGVRFWRINKASALDGGALTMESFTVTGAGGTLVPVSTLDASETVQYVVRTGTANFSGSGRMQLYRIGGPLGATTLQMATNASLGSAWTMSLPDAPQLGSTSLIQTNDDRVLSAVYRDNSVWCTHAVGMPAGGASRCSVKWWQITPETGVTIQEGVLDDTTGKHYYYPALTVNSTGHMMLAFSGSSATEYPSAYYAWRNASAPPGVLEGVRQYHAGVGSYNGPRWGDYSGIYLDPVDDTSVWAVQQYGEVSNRWGIQWVQLKFTSDPESLPAAGFAGLVMLSVLMIVGGGYLARRSMSGVGTKG